MSEEKLVETLSSGLSGIEGEITDIRRALEDIDRTMPGELSFDADETYQLVMYRLIAGVCIQSKMKNGAITKEQAEECHKMTREAVRGI